MAAFRVVEKTADANYNNNRIIRLRVITSEISFRVIQTLESAVRMTNRERNLSAVTAIRPMIDRDRHF